MSSVKIKRINDNAIVPVYATSSAAGADIHACLDHNVTIAPGETVLIPTGFAVQIPEGYAGLIFARSGLATKRSLAPANKVGVIDSDYRGEVMVSLHNHGQQEQDISHGDRIAQLVIVPVLTPEFELCDELDDTQRGAGGFGSTGK